MAEIKSIDNATIGNINWTNQMKSLKNYVQINFQKHQKYMLLDEEKIKIIYKECLIHLNNTVPYFEIFGISLKKFCDNGNFDDFLILLKNKKNNEFESFKYHKSNPGYYHGINNNVKNSKWNFSSSEKYIESILLIGCGEYFKKINPPLNEILEFYFGIFFNIEKIFNPNEENPFFKPEGLYHFIIFLENLVNDWESENKLILKLGDESGVFSQLSLDSLLERIKKIETELKELKNEKQEEINQLKQNFSGFIKQFENEISNNNLQQDSPEKLKNFLKKVSKVGIPIFQTTATALLVHLVKNNI